MILFLVLLFFFCGTANGAEGPALKDPVPFPCKILSIKAHREPSEYYNSGVDYGTGADDIQARLRKPSAYIHQTIAITRGNVVALVEQLQDYEIYSDGDVTMNHEFLTGDLNGDGLPDFMLSDLRASTSYSAQNAVALLWLSGPKGFKRTKLNAYYPIRASSLMRLPGTPGTCQLLLRTACRSTAGAAYDVTFQLSVEGQSLVIHTDPDPRFPLIAPAILPTPENSYWVRKQEVPKPGDRQAYLSRRLRDPNDHPLIPEAVLLRP